MLLRTMKSDDPLEPLDAVVVEATGSPLMKAALLSVSGRVSERLFVRNSTLLVDRFSLSKSPTAGHPSAPLSKCGRRSGEGGVLCR